jgi:hypothetical protein
MRNNVLVAFCMLSLATTAMTADFAPQTRLTLRGDRFVINGSAVDLYGIRVASASQSDEYTKALIESLDDYKAHGVNGITVFLQGSSGGFSDPFSPDGTMIDSNHARRVKQIVEACDRRGMIAIVGIFYQRTMRNMDDTRRLRDTAAVRQAVRTTTTLLRDYANVIINIANEQNSGLYRGVNFFDFNDPERIIELCELVHEIHPGRLVGGGGYHDALNVTIGRSAAVDVLLFDTFSKDIEANQDSGWHYDHFVERGVVGKPIVNVELFGGWTKQCVSGAGEPGSFRSEHKQLYFREVDAAARRPGLSVFFHANPWCQGPSMDKPVRYDLAGQGTPDDPGIRWWFEYVRTKR